jgi:hypothetical protein
MAKKEFEEHVKKLLSDFGLINQYEEVEKIISKAQGKNYYSTKIPSGKYAYFFKAGKFITPTIVRIVVQNKYGKYLKNKSILFTPIYLPGQDRIVTLTYWGKYKEFFKEEENQVIQFTSDLTCYPSGRCKYKKIDSESSDNKLRNILGLYWTFSLSLPYEERNLLFGNIFITVGNDKLSLSKIYHTFIVKQGNDIKYLDINFSFKKCEKCSLKQDEYLSFLLIKELEGINKNNKEIIHNKEIIPYHDKGHFKEIDVLNKLAFLILRSMYLRRSIDNLDYLNIGNYKEFRQIFYDLFNKLIINSISSTSNINVNFDIDKWLKSWIKSEDLEIRSNGRSIRMFIVDDVGDIIFVHPLITVSFLDNKKNAEIYESIVNNVLGKSMKRKEFIKTLNTPSQNFLSLKEKLRKFLDYNNLYDDGDVHKIINTFKSIYTSVLLSKLDVQSN